MVRETDPFTPEQIRLLEQTKEKVLKMLDGVEGMSEEVRENVAVRVAQFTLGVGGISVFDKAILVYFNRDTGISGFHMV